MLGARLIGSRLQRAEQEIEPARLIGADLRQLARRFRQFLLLLGDGRRILRKRKGWRRGSHRRYESGYEEGLVPEESQCHRQSLDAHEGACKAASVKRL